MCFCSLGFRASFDLRLAGRLRTHRILWSRLLYILDRNFLHVYRSADRKTDCIQVSFKGDFRPYLKLCAVYLID